MQLTGKNRGLPWSELTMRWSSKASNCWTCQLMSLLERSGGIRRKGWSKLYLPREEWALPGSPSGMHDAFDMLSFALLFPSKWYTAASQKEGENSKWSVLKGGLLWNPSVLLANTYWIDWRGGVTVFCPPLLIQRQSSRSLGCVPSPKFQ